MKCMVLEKFDAPLVLRERAIPTPGSDEVILKVGACGLCRTDLKLYHGTHPRIAKIALPLVLGHEVAGEVVEAGKSVGKELLGKHAVVYLYFGCGECEFCKNGLDTLCNNLRGQLGYSVDGGMAEYVKVPASALFVIPAEIPFEQIAIVTDAIATPYRALTAKARLQAGETLAVIGSGGLGIHAIQIAKALGARVMAVDINEKALSLAREMGAEKTFDLSKPGAKEEILGLNGGVQVVADFVAQTQTQQLGLNLLAPGGRFVSIAYAADNVLPVPTPLLVSRELQIYGARSCSRADLQSAIDLVACAKVKPLVATRYSLEEANTALVNLEKGEMVGRSVLIP